MSPEEAKELQVELKRDIPWVRQEDTYGPQDRLTHYIGDTRAVFRYVGISLTPSPWNPLLIGVRRRLEDHVIPVIEKYLANDCVQAGEPTRLHGCLLNYYERNKSFIPWHSDEVRAHGRLKIVATVSLGGPRQFLLRRRCGNADFEDTESKQDSISGEMEVVLRPGSVLVMAGNTQTYYEHALPLHTDQNQPPRISLTFRSIVPGFERANTDY